MKTHWHEKLEAESLGLLDDDWLLFFPLTLERDVEIVVEESVHYVQGDPGGANDEWWECGEPKGEPVSTVREASAPLAGRSYHRCIAQTLHYPEHYLLCLHRQLTNCPGKYRFPPTLHELPPPVGAVPPRLHARIRRLRGVRL